MNNEVNYAPVAQLKTNRGLIKLFLLSLITFGLYPLFFYASVADDVNVICSRYDGKKTMNYWLMTFIVAPLTMGIGGLVWCHNLSNRIGNEMKRRNLPHRISAGTFWLWNTLGLLIGIGPLVYIHKLCKAMNTLAKNYNTCG